MNNSYTILDLDGFVEATRVLVFDAFGKEKDTDPNNLVMHIERLKQSEREELESVLTQQEAMMIAKGFMTAKKSKNKNIKYTITENKYFEMIESMNERLVSNMIRNLTKLGLLESAYDTELNDFVFWIKDDNEQKS